MSILRQAELGQLAAEEIHDQRELDLEILEVHGHLYETRMKQEDRWRTVRAGVWLAPLATACVLVEGLGSHLNEMQNAGVLTGSLFASFLGWAAAEGRREKSYAKARDSGLAAVEVVERLGIAAPPWVEKSLQPDASSRYQSSAANPS